MGDKITIVEIAKMANVSTATVSRVINNTGKVDEAKRERILSLIEQYNYKPNFIAKTLQSSKSNIVGFVVPHIISPYYSQVFFEAELIAQKKGITLMLGNSESELDVESKILDTFVSTNVRAIVFMGGRLEDVSCDKKYLEELEKINKTIPVISCVDVPGLSCIQVYEDERACSDKLLEHLANMGYKTIVLAGGVENIRTTIARRNEIEEKAPKYGLEVCGVINSGYSVESGINTMEELSKLPKMPDVAICINDLVATGLLSEVQHHKMSVPSDIAIVGYDDMESSAFLYPGLTTISANYKEYAQRIVDTIMDIDNIDSKVKFAVPRELTIRGTTKK